MDPLGMPRGSVRGLLALLIVGTACLLFILGRDVPEALIALVGAVIPYYFLHRQDESRRADEVAESVPEQPYIAGQEPEDPSPPPSW